LHGLRAQARGIDVQALEHATSRAAWLANQRDEQMNRGYVTIAHATSDLTGPLQAHLDRIIELFLDASRRAQQLFGAQFSLAEQIASRARARGDRREQVRAGGAFLLLLRQLIRDAFHESELGLEATTSHHLIDLPAIEKTANFPAFGRRPRAGQRLNDSRARA